MARTPPLLDGALTAVAAGTHDDAFAVLGCHAVHGGAKGDLVVRTMQPAAGGVELLAGGREWDMRQCHPAGLFEVTLAAGEGLRAGRPYRFRVHEHGGAREIDDPYRFGRVLGDLDLHMFGEGTHYRAWEHFGSRPTRVDGIDGVHFAVWAPNAQRVSVIGDFNQWDGRVHPMRRLSSSGVWEIFIPELPDGPATSSRSARRPERCSRRRIRSPSGSRSRRAARR